MASISKSHLYRLLYLALIELRAEGHNKEQRMVFLLADLFHNVPLQLDRVDRGDLALEDILRWLRMRAQGTPMEAWLNLREQEVMKDGKVNGAPLNQTTPLYPDGEMFP